MLIAENDDYKRHVKLAVDELLMAKDKLTCSAINLNSINGVLRHIEFALDVLKKEKGDDYGSARQIKIQAETEGITLPAPKSSPTRSD